jgi:hypothetical protein
MMGGVSPETCSALRNIGIINSSTQLHRVGSFCEIYVTMHASMNMMFWRTLLLFIV